MTAAQVAALERKGDEQLSRLGHYGLVIVIAVALCSTNAAPIGALLLTYATIRAGIVAVRWLSTVRAMRDTVRSGVTTCPCSCHLPDPSDQSTEGAT